MKRISFNPKFVNKAGNDLVPGKIHTIRQNYSFWKQYEGKEVALYTWEGKPYRSKQKVFCIKRIVSVQEFELKKQMCFWFVHEGVNIKMANKLLSVNDGFNDITEFYTWFADYKPGKMAILHFTDFRY